MPLDPSISLQAGQGVTPLSNPLVMAGQYQALQNATDQNRLINASVDSTQAGTAQTNQNIGINSRMQQAQSQSEWLGLPTNLRTQGTAIQMSADNLKRGIITQPEYDSSVAAINAAPDQKSLDQLGHLALLHIMTGPERASQIFGAMGNQTNGQSITPGVQTSPMAQALNGAPSFTPTQAPIEQFPSRTDLNNRVQVGRNPDGSPIYGPIANVTPSSLGGPAVSGFGSGAFPDALRNPNNPKSAFPSAAANTTTQTPGAQSNGNVTTSLGPAEASSLAARGTASAGAFQQIADQGVAARSQNAILGNMLGDAAGFSSGQTDLNGYKAAVGKYAPGLNSFFGITPAAVAANESFDKLSNQIASQQGSGSDARLAVAQGANPSSHLSPAGVDQIIRQLQGNSDYLSARAKVAASYPDQTDRAGFESNVGSQLDPRAFQFNRLTPAQKTSYVATLSPQDRAKIQSSYNYAYSNGLVGGQNGAQ